MRARVLGAALGVGMDLVLGDRFLDPHPVAAFGGIMERLETSLYRDTRSAGVLHATLGAAIGTTAGAGVRSTAFGTYVAVAHRGLVTAAAEVRAALDAGDLEGARSLLPALVGRDTRRLGVDEISRATVESVAENTVDAVVAPAFYAATLGAPGVLGYRAINTLDAMVGHRSPRYLRYGWASARLDDAANYVPARLTAGLVIAARPHRAAQIWRAVQTDAPAHPSPNAGVAEAAFAGALGVRLGGPLSYGGTSEDRPLLGAGRAAGPGDIDAAIRLCRDVTVLLVATLVAVGVRR